MNRQVIVMVGLPGSGKTTWIREGARDALVCSADQHFERDGVYRFDATQLSAAHEACLKRYAQWVTAPTFRDPTACVIDNTNMTNAERAPYIALALAFGLDVVVMQMEVAPDIAGPRNIHGVPMRAVYAMHDRKESLPPHWERHPRVTMRSVFTGGAR